MAESPRGLLHVVRTVRRAGFVGKEAGAGAIGNVNPEALGSMAASSLAIGVSAAEIPEMAGVFGALIAVGLVSQFVQPSLGGILVLPSIAEIHQPQLYSDQVRKMYLEKIHGVGEGDKIWNAEWSQRQISIDLRSRSP
jgi:hypothetical protein